MAPSGKPPLDEDTIQILLNKAHVHGYLSITRRSWKNTRSWMTKSDASENLIQYLRRNGVDVTGEDAEETDSEFEALADENVYYTQISKASLPAIRSIYT